jgi:protein SCO1/2
MRTHSLPLAGALLALALLAGCDAPGRAAPDATSPTAAAAEHRHGAEPPPAGEVTDHSVYHLEGEWRDQRGETRPLASLAGRVQVVAMVYTHCGHACPRTLVDMKRIEGETVDAGDVGFVLVSIDPERDTPEQLARFAEGARLDPARWTLLTGADDDVLGLAALLGVKFRRENEAEWSHTNLITVLDRHGEVVHRQLGYGEGVDRTVEAVRDALAAAGGGV